jgi:hypothetical protein
MLGAMGQTSSPEKYEVSPVHPAVLSPRDVQIELTVPSGSNDRCSNGSCRDHSTHTGSNQESFRGSSIRSRDNTLDNLGGMLLLRPT